MKIVEGRISRTAVSTAKMVVCNTDGELGAVPRKCTEVFLSCAKKALREIGRATPARINRPAIAVNCLLSMSRLMLNVDRDGHFNIESEVVVESEYACKSA